MGSILLWLKSNWHQAYSFLISDDVDILRVLLNNEKIPM